MSLSLGDILKYVYILEPMVKEAQTAFGAGSGAEKKAAVMDLFESVITTAAPMIETSHPQYATIIGKFVDLIVELENVMDAMPAAPATPPTTPPVLTPPVVVPVPPVTVPGLPTPVIIPPVILPPPPPTSQPPSKSDPTTVEYATQAEAVAASGLHDGTNYPNVILKANGKYCVWPAIGPFPGTIVWSAP
jgi:hypothetical protein